MTPRQLALLRKRYDERQQDQELLAGIIAATIANHSFSPPNKPYAPGDFMPSQLAEKQRRERRQKNQYQIADDVRSVMSILMGS